MENMIQETKELLHLDEDECFKRFINNRWNKEAVINSAETEDEDMENEAPTAEKHLCEVCYIEYDITDTFSMNCGH